MRAVDATCAWCKSQFSYDPLVSTGKYCSNKCSGEDRSWECYTEWLAGTRTRAINRRVLRSYLIRCRGNFCAVCNIPGEWQGQPLVLEVDHIDGDARDNSPANTRLICPNCHSQTPTHSGRNRGKGRKSRGLKPYS